MSYIRKRFNDIFTEGDLFKILKTGETLVYVSSEGGANWSSYVTVRINNKVDVETGLIWLHEVVKVNEKGEVIDDFSSLPR